MTVRWVRRGLVLVADLEPPPPSPAPRPVHELIACPTCRARVDESCRTPAGNVREPHTTRLVARTCPCGASLAPRKQLCERCRQAARTATYRRRELRQPTATRRRLKESA